MTGIIVLGLFFFCWNGVCAYWYLKDREMAINYQDNDQGVKPDG